LKEQLILGLTPSAVFSMPTYPKLSKTTD